MGLIIRDISQSSLSNKIKFKDVDSNITYLNDRINSIPVYPISSNGESTGIGKTPNTQSVLDVSGSSYFTGSVKVTGSISVEGNVNLSITGSIPTFNYGGVPTDYLGAGDGTRYLSLPDKWIKVNIGGSDYLIPAFLP